MATVFSPSWQRFFAQAAPAAAAPAAHPSFRRVPLVAAGAVPPIRPKPPVDQRPIPPESPRRRQELAWLTWQMPKRLREAVSLNVRQTLGWRAQYCQPLDAPKKPPEYRRFGLLGEGLCPQGAPAVCKTLREELREMVREVEGQQSRLEHNRLLAMRGARLGQLCAELEQRGLDTLEELRGGLSDLWV